MFAHREFSFFNLMTLSIVHGIALFLFGSCIGSFLNVCIDRWVKGQSVIKPRSYCPHCQKNIPWYLNIPVLTWLLLKGKTRCCGKPIPFRYFLSEVGIGLLAVLTFVYANSLAVPCFVLLCLLWIAFWSDCETMLIPDQVTLGGLLLGIILSSFYPQMQLSQNTFEAAKESFIGMCVGAGSLFLVASIAECFVNEEALGLGDMKLLGCIGAFLGTSGCLYALLLGSMLGTLFIVLHATFIKLFRPKTDINRRMAFGPFLALGAVVYTILVLWMQIDPRYFLQYNGDF